MTDELKNVDISSPKSIMEKIHKRKEENENAIKALTEIVETMTPEEIARALHTERRKTEWAKRHAISDSLTGLFRRLPFVRESRREMELLNRENRDAEVRRGLTFALADIDNFGAYNSMNGEHMGDEALRGLGKKFREETRKTDFVCRWGGEEFALALPYSKEEQKKEEEEKVIPVSPVERLRRNIDKVKIEKNDQLFEEIINLTFGATDYIPGETFKDIFSRISNALRIAKLLGKNRTVIAENGLYRDLSNKKEYTLKKDTEGEILTNISENIRYRIEINPTPKSKPNLVKLP